MPHPAHDAASARLSFLVLSQTARMNLDEQLNPRGSTTSQGRHSGSQPDASFIPRTLPTGRSRQWPSLVVEVGYTQTNNSLRMKARWWIGNSGGNVKIVVLIFINQTRAEMDFEVWENVPRQNPPITRPQAQGRQSNPTQTQQASARLQPALQTIAVVGAPLRLPFRSVFLRNPNPNPLETDFSFSQQDIESIAEAAWIEQGFV